MLVLSRRPSQQIVFSNLGVTVDILSVKGSVVKVGIEAPDDVHILRSEITGQPHGFPRMADGMRKFSRTQYHDLCNQLHSANLALRLFEKQRAAGLDDEAQATFETVLDQFAELNQQFANRRPNRSETSTSPPSPSYRVLLVEDDDNERELMAGFLRMCGYDVATAGDGLEALAYLERHPQPNLVVLDMKMPRFDGVQTVEAIRGNLRFEELKVCAVSATSPQELGVGVERGGVDCWFQKPLDPERFVRELRSWMQAT